jgi:tripartite-type tricarboxylate transporter receptor subunit TctC
MPDPEGCSAAQIIQGVPEMNKTAKHVVLWILGLAVAALGFLGGSLVHAQSSGDTLKIVVPYPAGGGSDVVARLLAEKLKVSLARPVIVENKPGAGGRVGTEYAKGLPPDGSSMLVVNPALFVVNPVVYPKLDYDPDKDFQPLSQITVYHFVLSVPASSPARDFKELLKWLKEHPKEANFGSPAAGSLPHFFGLMVSRYAGVEMVHVPYNGSAPLVTALIGGQIPVGIDTYEAQSPHHPEKIRILATAGTSRKHPDIPTFSEMGFSEIQGVGWNGLVVPARTPREVVERLSRAVMEAIKSPDVASRIKELGVDPTGTTPEEFARIIQEDRKRWVPVVQASGFKPE